MAKEVSYLKAELESARTDLGSMNSKLESVCFELESVRSELGLAHIDHESAEWIIETQES